MTDERIERLIARAEAWFEQSSALAAAVRALVLRLYGGK